MSSSDSRAETIFFAALERASPEERARYVEEACAGDEQLRRRIERLLIAQLKVGRFLESPAVNDASALELGLGPEAAPVVRMDTGTVIGPYKLLEPIGEGGMAVVFLAEQTRPIQRKVALKVIKPGMASRQVIARFEAERQALAMMDHPNIAKVFDAGTTESGQPYFVMELVKGVPITAYCDELRLTPAQRLELFVQVCSAVQHAHQKGIIHRDLKPSNVLVAPYDGTPVPKVIDFGIAKAMGQPLTERTMFTGLGDVVGTLQYMSPEQAELNQLDVDTRSDIYSLGVLLYELLTGTTPLEKGRLKGGALLEMLRAVREEEPPRPSTRLSTTNQLPSISASRGLEPKKLSGLVHGELDWIVMKALEKDRNRRYETVTGLAMDVRRYLNDEPVAAGPPSGAYRLRKFARRHKPAIAVALALGLAVLLGLVGLLVNNRMVTRERNQKEAALAAALREKGRADENLLRARNAVNEYLTTVANNPLLREADFHELRRTLLESAIPFYEEFVAQRHEDPQLEVERGRAYGDLALVREELGHPAQALDAHEQRRAVFERLAERFPSRLDYRHELANTHRNAGNIHYAANRHAEAEAEFRRAVTMLDELVSQHPSAAPYRQDLAGAYNNLSVLLRALGRQDEALDVQEKAVALRERLVGDLPADPQYRRDFAESLLNLSSVHSNLSRHDDALASNRRAVKLLQGLAEQQPRSPLYREMWGASLDNQSVLLCALGRLDEGLAALEQALRINEQLAADFQSVPGYRFGLAVSLLNLAMLQSEMGRAQEGLATCKRARAVLQELVRESPDAPPYQQALATAWRSQSDLDAQLRQFENAIDAIREGLVIQEKLVLENPAVPRLREELATMHASMGEALSQLGRHDEAAASFARALPVREELVRTFPSVAAHAVNLAGTCGAIGNLHLEQRDALAAIGWYDEALARLDPVLAAEPRLAQARGYASKIRANRAAALGELSRHDEALADIDQALSFSDDGGRHPALQLARAATLARLGRHREATAEADSATRSADVSASLLHDAAVVYALSAGQVGEDPGLLEQYAARAVALLRRATEGNDAPLDVELMSDTVFDPLRRREDFQKLVTDINSDRAVPATSKANDAGGAVFEPDARQRNSRPRKE